MLRVALTCDRCGNLELRHVRLPYGPIKVCSFPLPEGWTLRWDAATLRHSTVCVVCVTRSSSAIARP
jgi:hypothetical protein